MHSASTEHGWQKMHGSTLNTRRTNIGLTALVSSFIGSHRGGSVYMVIVLVFFFFVYGIFLVVNNAACKSVVVP